MPRLAILATLRAVGAAVADAIRSGYILPSPMDRRFWRRVTEENRIPDQAETARYLRAQGIDPSTGFPDRRLRQQRDEDELRSMNLL